MKITEYRNYDAAEIMKLYSSAGWTAYTAESEKLERAFRNSLFTLAACEEGKLLGLVRTVGDGETVVYIQDLLVFPEHQGKGIGSALIRQVFERFPDVRQIVLAADDIPELSAFYHANGMAAMPELGCCGYMKA